MDQDNLTQQRVPAPPPGFVLDEQPVQPPPGFVLDQKEEQIAQQPPVVQPQAPQQQKPSFLKQMFENAMGIGEAVVSPVSGMASGMLGAVAAIPKLASDIVPVIAGKITGLKPPEETRTPFQNAEKLMGKIGEVGTYVPKTEMGQYLTSVINSPFEVIGVGVDELSKRLTKNPEAQAAVRTGGNLVLNGLLFHYGTRLVKGKPITGAEIKRVTREQNIPDWMKRKFENIPDDKAYTPTPDDIAYAQKLQDMQATSARTPEQVKTWAEQYREGPLEVEYPSAAEMEDMYAREKSRQGGGSATAAPQPPPSTEVRVKTDPATGDVVITIPKGETREITPERIAEQKSIRAETDKAFIESAAAKSAELNKARPKRSVSDFLKEQFDNLRMESMGEAALNNIIDRGASPQGISEEFWNNTYDKLPDVGKRRIEKYLQKLSGMKIGDAIAIDKEGRPIVAESWKQLGLEQDLGKDASMLEGADRGYVVLLDYANNMIKKSRLSPEGDLGLPPVPPAEIEAQRVIREKAGENLVRPKPVIDESKIPDVFKKMPPDVLNSEKYDGVEGAKLERERRKQPAQPVAPETTPKPTVPEPTPVAKEPWQMTEKEYVDYYQRTAYEKEYGSMAGFDTWKESQLSAQERNASAMNALDDHYDIIQRAISEGKSVPPEVLAEYPDLAKPTPPKGKPVAREGVDVEVLPDFTEEQAKAAEREAAEKKLRGKQNVAKENLSRDNPYWKDEYWEYVPVALEKAKIFDEHQSKAAILLQKYFNPAKVEGDTIAIKMTRFLRSQRKNLAKDERIESTFAKVKNEAGEEVSMDRYATYDQVPLRRTAADQANALRLRTAFDRIRKDLTDDQIKTLDTIGMDADEAASDLKINRTTLIERRKALTKLIEADPEVKKIAEDVRRSVQEIDSSDMTAQELIDEIENPPLPEGKIKAGGLLPSQRRGGAQAGERKYVGSINLEKVDESNSIKNYIEDIYESNPEHYDKARRKGITLDEIKDKADFVFAGKTPEEMGRSIAKAMHELPEKLYATETVAEQCVKDAMAKAKEYELNPTEENHVKYASAKLRAEAMIGYWEMGASESSHTLAMHKLLKKAHPYSAVKNWQMAKKILGKNATDENMLHLLAKMDDPLQAMRFIVDAREVRFRDKVYEFWINALLSSPKTHMRNVIGNTAALFAKPAETFLKAGAEAFVAPLEGRPREVYFTQGIREMMGALSGIHDGVERARFAWANEVTRGGISKLENIRYPAIKGAKGRAIRTPGRSLMSADEFFKGVIEKSDLYSTAWKTAFKEMREGKVTKQNFDSRVADLVNSPTEAMAKHATEEALRLTFQNDLGKIAKQMSRLKGEHYALNYIVPFWKTPINIAKYGLERTPLNIFRIAKMMAEGKFKGEAISTELSKVAIGGLAITPVIALIANGKITGSAPDNKNERDAFFRQGKMEYSLKTPYGWVSYRGLEPVSTTVGTIADYVLAFDKLGESTKTEFATQVLTSLYKNMQSQSFNQGWISFIDMIRDPNRYGDKFLSRLATSVIPSVSGEIARDIDPNIRQARNIIDSAKAKIPGLSKQVPPRKDLFGEESKRGGSVAYRFLSPQPVSKDRMNAIESEFNRLKYYPSMPARKSNGVDMPRDQWEFFSSYVGKLSKSYMTELIDSSPYKMASDLVKIKLIKNTFRRARNIARLELKMRFSTPEKFEELEE